MSNKPTVPPSDTTDGDNSLRNYLVEEFVEDYQEGRTTRREALRKLSAIFGSVVVATSFLAACAPEPTPTPEPPPATQPPTSLPAATTAPSATPAPATASPPTVVASATVVATLATTPVATASPVTISPDDPDIEAKMVEFDSNGAKIMSYLAKPKGNGPFPSVLICHENRGLVEHIKDVARRAAKARYAALAIDLLSQEGGTDTRINAGIPEIEAAMKQNNKVFEKLVYDGAGHAFHNDTGANYNANAAKDAWAKTLAWLDKYVRS